MPSYPREPIDAILVVDEARQCAAESARREDRLQVYRTDEGAASLRKRFPMPRPED